jgi:hypothetical protein
MLFVPRVFLQSKATRFCGQGSTDGLSLPSDGTEARRDRCKVLARRDRCKVLARLDRCKVLARLDH